MSTITPGIRMVPAQDIEVSKIKFDERNPNVMSEQQVEALGKVIDDFGYANDIWVNSNKDGTYTIIDGEHRLRLLQKKNVSTVTAKVFSLSYPQVQILRQVANKLRGEHDTKKDLAEFKDIAKSGLLADFAAYLAEPVEMFENMVAEDYDYEDPIESEKSSVQVAKHKCPQCGFEFSD